MVPGWRWVGAPGAALRRPGGGHPVIIRGRTVFGEEGHGVALALWEVTRRIVAMMFVKRLIQGYVIARVIRFLRRKM